MSKSLFSDPILYHVVARVVNILRDAQAQMTAGRLGRGRPAALVARIALGRHILAPRSRWGKVHATVWAVGAVGQGVRHVWVCLQTFPFFRASTGCAPGSHMLPDALVGKGNAQNLYLVP
eukprot:gene17712-biopygen9891